MCPWLSARGFAPRPPLCKGGRALRAGGFVRNGHFVRCPKETLINSVRAEPVEVRTELRLEIRGAAVHPSTSLRYAQGERGMNQRLPESAQRLLRGGCSRSLPQQRFRDTGIAANIAAPTELHVVAPAIYYSEDKAATMARSDGFTDSTLKSRAPAAMRVSAAASGMGGFLSFFFNRTQRTGLIRATT